MDKWQSPTPNITQRSLCYSSLLLTDLSVCLLPIEQLLATVTISILYAGVDREERAAYHPVYHLSRGGQTVWGHSTLRELQSNPQYCRPQYPPNNATHLLSIDIDM